MFYYVYILIHLNNKDNTTYVGYTKNLTERLKLHNSSKGAKFTKGKEWNLVYFKKYYTKSKAMKEEYILKKNTKKRNILKKKFIDKL